MIAALLLPALLWGTGVQAALNAYFDRTRVFEGDAVTLTIEADGMNVQGQPDLSPLAHDFDVLGTSSGSQISIVNGRQSAKQIWSIELAPKHTGMLTVPPIGLAGDRTQPLQLEVSEMPEGARGGPGDDVFVEIDLDVDGDTVMVQQQIPVTVRLYSALPIRGGDLSEPRADGAVLERLGPDTQYETERNGRVYRVIERRFSLSPEHSGELRIPPVVFEGALSSPRRDPMDERDRLRQLFRGPALDRLFEDPVLGGNPFDLLQPGRPVRAQSQAITLRVKARPDGYAGKHWLPAESVVVDDAWSTQPPQLRAGEPATRTITVTAKGLAGTQIPEIEIPAPAGARTYREKTESQSRTDGATLYGVSVQKVTVIPTGGSTLEMPELRVRWWDTLAEQERVAVVPALTLDVEGAPAASAPEPTAAASGEPSPASAQAGAGGAASGPETTPAPPDGGTRDGGLAGWPAVAAALVAPALLGLAAVLIRRRGGRPPRRIKIPTVRRPEDASTAAGRTARAALRQACETHDARGAATALLAWARALWPDSPPASLGALADRLQRSPRTQAAAGKVRTLERQLYAPEAASAWSGAELWQTVESGLLPAQGRRREDGDTLAPLYPRRS